MKVLLDTCVWGGAKAELQAVGHDVLWIGDSTPDPGDEDILALAYREQRVLVTLVNRSRSGPQSCRCSASAIRTDMISVKWL